MPAVAKPPAPVAPELDAARISEYQALDKETIANKFVWLPQAGPQTAAYFADVDELLYGGARGGGKTALLLGRFAGQAAAYGPFAIGVIFRRTYKQLDEVVQQGKMYFCKHGFAKWKRAEFTFEFINGATLRLRHIDSLSDCDNYVGQSLSYIGFDELGVFRDFKMYLNLLACARSSHPRLRPVVVATANPGGRLHNEIKEYWRIGQYPLGSILLRTKQGRTRMYVKSLLADNQYLAGTSYEKILQSIKDPQVRRAWLEGDWDICQGTFFGDLWDAKRHIVQLKGNPPHGWPRFRSMDWGSAKPYAVLWWTIASDEQVWAGRRWPRGAIIVYRELYGCDPEEKDTGLRETVTEVAEKILKTERDHKDVMVKPGPADTAMWQSPDGGPSIAERFHQAKVHFVKAFKSRVVGWEEVRIRLSGQGHDQSMLYFGSQCANAIKQIPTVVRSEDSWDDLDSQQEDHICDCLRYICMARPTPGKTQAQKEKDAKTDAHRVLDPRMGM